MVDERLLPPYLYNDIQSLTQAIEEKKPIDIWLDELWGSINMAFYANEITAEEADYLRHKYIWGE